MLEIRVYKKKWYQILNNPKKTIKRLISLTLDELKISSYNPTISIVLADDILLHELNLRYRNKDSSTNVLSFQYSNELLLDCYLGEIIISLEDIVKEANEYKISIKNHFSHILIHGLLHILNYDHTTYLEEQVMQKTESSILFKLGIADPYSLNLL